MIYIKKRKKEKIRCMDFTLKEGRGGVSLKNTPQGKCIVGFRVQVRYQKDYAIGITGEKLPLFSEDSFQRLFPPLLFL